MVPDVLTKRLGIPISLAVVHAAVGRRVGLPIDLVGVPMHVVNRIAPPGSPQERYIDVFDGGRVMTRCASLLAAIFSIDRKLHINYGRMSQPCVAC